jgi:hypothetical protein
MGVLGEMFPGAKIQDEASEAADGQKWRLGPIDLENGVVEVHRAAPTTPDEDEPESRG